MLEQLHPHGASGFLLFVPSRVSCVCVCVCMYVFGFAAEGGSGGWVAFHLVSSSLSCLPVRPPAACLNIFKSGFW